MKSVLAIVLMAVACRSVFGATCSDETSRSCEATDFTMAACDSGVCTCEDGYGPIPSGCGKKFSRPEVNLPAGRTNKLINSKDGILTCNTPEETSVSSIIEYAWYKGGNKVNGQTEKTYTVSSAGSYSCKIVAKETELENLNSDMSESLDIMVLAVGTSVEDKPKIEESSIPSKAIDGKQVTPICGNIPMGANHDFQDQDDNEQIPPITTSIGTITAVKCIVMETASVNFINPESDPVNMPAVPVDVDSATVQINDMTNTDYNFNIDSTVVATCVTEPPATLLDEAKLQYQFKVNDSDADTKKEYTVMTNTAKMVEITCEVSYDAKTAKTSAKVMVTVSNDFIQKPVVQASATKPVPKARLVLTCNAPGADMITWMKGNDPIQRQNDHILQFDNYADGDQTFNCTASKGSFVIKSDGKIINPQANIEKPIIQSSDSSYGVGGNYGLTCHTDSTTVGMTYEWKKDDETLSTVSSVFAINNAKDANNGNYTCKAMFNEATSDVSDKLTVKIEAAGLPCTTATQDTVCVGNSYTGTCNNQGRCECADNFKPKGTACESHGVALVSSMVLVIAAAIVAKLI